MKRRRNKGEKKEKEVEYNKPDRAKMRPGCVSACIDQVTYMYGQTD